MRLRDATTTHALIRLLFALPAFRVASAPGPPMSRPLGPAAIRAFCAAPSRSDLADLYLFPCEGRPRRCPSNLPLNSTLSPAAVERVLSNATCAAELGALHAQIRRVLRLVDDFLQAMVDFVPCSSNVTFLEDYEDYSVATNCDDCLLWYRHWLTASQMYDKNWAPAPCAQFCVLAELHCPQWKNTNITDYAGLPSFRCSDPDVAHTGIPGADADCVSPSDLGLEPPSDRTPRTRSTSALVPLLLTTFAVRWRHFDL